MKNDFPNLLSRLRRDAKLTNIQLAESAPVSRSLIAGLQSGKRCVGEYQARKIGKALGLSDKGLDDFIFSGIDRCTEKVLVESFPYPAELLNLVARILRRGGITPEKISDYWVQVESGVSIVKIILADGRSAHLESKLEIKA